MNGGNMFQASGFHLVQFLCVALGVAAASVCRLDSFSGPMKLPPDNFKKTSCAICYLYIGYQGPALLNNTLNYNPNVDPYVWFDEQNTSHFADPDDVNNLVYNSFLYEYTRNQWKQCCHQAADCCMKMQNDTEYLDTEGTNNDSCPSSWDLYHCWPRLQRDQSIEVDCPDYLFAYMPKPPCKRNSIGTCQKNSTWTRTAYCESLEFHRRPEDGQSPEEVARQEAGEDVEERCCRTEREYQLSAEAYAIDTCARCYDYIPEINKIGRLWYHIRYGALVDMDTREMLVAETSNVAILKSLLGDDVKKKWINCCEKAVECCHQMTEAANYTSGPFCPRTWDGWQCFEDTAVGATAYVDCPVHAYYSQPADPQCTRRAEKLCVSHNVWYKKIKKGEAKEYTNYTPCSRKVEHRNQEYFYIACNALSLVALVPALVIFSSYRQLRVARIQMHRNFFLALALSSILSISYRTVVIFPELQNESDLKTPVEENGAGCKILLMFCRYTRLCTYTWMLCEGFYLQRLITCAFVEQKRLVGYYIVGWVFPLLPLIVYATVILTQADVRCWTNPTIYEWIFGSVYLSCILMNLIFLFNIIRVLITKLRSVHSTEPSHYRKAVRATLVLIPLFGTHFFLGTYNGHNAFSSCAGVTFYAYFKSVIDGLQGFCVSLIYCYFNGEVLGLLRRTYVRIQIDRGIQPNIPRTRWSVSTQNTNVIDHQSRGTSPPGKGSEKKTLLTIIQSVKDKKYSGTTEDVKTVTTPSAEKKSKPKPDVKSVSNDTIIPGKPTVTEL